MAGEYTLKLFHEAAEGLSAYKEFLAAHSVDPESIRTPADLQRVPITNKKRYLVPNELGDLMWPAAWNRTVLFCATSGSTGEPYYFPRDDQLSLQYSYVLEQFVNYSSYGKGSTLVIIGFGMGIWIGGIITLRAFEIAGERLDSPLAVLPAGYNKPEIFKALRKLSPQFDQTIIVGYPPFTKELMDEAEAEGIDLKKLHVRLLFAAEAFTETFRDHVCEKAGIRNPVLDTLNVYGSADIGAMAYETPLSILVRCLALEDPLLYRDLFGQVEKTPTLAQYNPEFIEFEAVGNELLLSANGVLPLVRYAVGDHGGVLSYEHIKSLMARYDVNLDAEISAHGLDQIAHREQPFVYVYERADFSATLQGINIYPEFIKEGLLRKEVAPYFTQRFTMATKNDIDHNQFLQINLELRQGIEPDDGIEHQAQQAVLAALTERSSEFAEVAKHRDSKRLVQVVLWPKGHTRYFGPGTKQKWVEKP